MGGLLLLVGLCVSLHALYRLGVSVMLTLGVSGCHGSGVRKHISNEDIKDAFS